MFVFGDEWTTGTFENFICTNMNTVVGPIIFLKKRGRKARLHMEETLPHVLSHWRRMNIVDIDALWLYSVALVCHCCWKSECFPRVSKRWPEGRQEEAWFHQESILDRCSVDVFDCVHRVESTYQRKIWCEEKRSMNRTKTRRRTKTRVETNGDNSRRHRALTADKRWRLSVVSRGKWTSPSEGRMDLPAWITFVRIMKRDVVQKIVLIGIDPTANTLHESIAFDSIHF